MLTLHLLLLHSVICFIFFWLCALYLNGVSLCLRNDCVLHLSAVFCRTLAIIHHCTGLAPNLVWLLLHLMGCFGFAATSWICADVGWPGVCICTFFSGISFALHPWPSARVSLFCVVFAAFLAILSYMSAHVHQLSVDLYVSEPRISRSLE
jgi:hypothetical protein